VKQETPLDHV